MAPYEARFMTHGDRVFDSERFDAETDARAIEYAKRIFTCHIGKGYEIWCKGRHVLTALFR